MSFANTLLAWCLAYFVVRSSRRWKTLLIITSPFHQFRSERVFRRLALKSAPTLKVRNVHEVTGPVCVVKCSGAKTRTVGRPAADKLNKVCHRDSSMRESSSAGGTSSSLLGFKGVLLRHGTCHSLPIIMVKGSMPKGCALHSRTVLCYDLCVLSAPY